MSELIDRERFSADMRDFQNRVGIWRDEAEDTETWTRADAALATIIETKLILDKQPTIAAPRWVRCEDDKPKKNGRYIVFDNKNGVYSAEFRKGRLRSEWTDEDEGWCNFRVTHWMPLPEPPKEDA